MKKCPFCAEEIQDDAIKCRFCNEFLDGRAARKVSGKKTKWYFASTTLVLGFCCVGPFILPLVWFHPQYSRKKKTVLTVVCLVATVILVQVTQASLSKINESYRMLQGL